MGDLGEIRSMLLLPRAEACAAELRRSASELRKHAGDDDEILHAAEGTLLMAETMEDMRAELGATVDRGEFLRRNAEFLLDLLTESNETVDALYGRTDSLGQAATELRAAIRSWRERTKGASDE